MGWLSAHLHQAPPVAFLTVLHSLPVDPCIGLQLIEVLQTQAAQAEKELECEICLAYFIMQHVAARNATCLCQCLSILQAAQSVLPRQGCNWQQGAFAGISGYIGVSEPMQHWCAHPEDHSRELQSGAHVGRRGGPAAELRHPQQLPCGLDQLPQLGSLRPQVLRWAQKPQDMLL